MRLNVPFFIQTTKVNCGPSALKMVLDYFGKKKTIEEIESKFEMIEGKGVSTIQIATVSSLFGFKTEFYSKSLLFDEENMKLDFYKKYANNNLEESKKQIKFAIESGVKTEEKTFSLENILKFVTKKSIPIILLDWNVVMNKREKGYQGHFVPIVGYDSKNVYVHNQGLDNPQEYLKISKEVFDESRKEKGTDEDFLIIYKK